MQQNEDIIYISTIDWDFIWQGHQEIACRLAASGNRILFIENTGVRSPSIKDIQRLRKRVSNWFHSIRGFRKINDNLFLYSPILLPFPYSRIALWINLFLLKQALKRWNNVMSFKRPIIFTYLPTQLINRLVEKINPSLFIYYCIDSFENSSTNARKILQSEQTMFKRADLVFATSHKLMEKARQWNSNCHRIPFGVSLKNFQVVPIIPEELKKIPHPIIGYVGGIHKWIDYTLLAQVIRQLPHYSFVLVGPKQTDTSALELYSNVYFTGKKSHTELPHYIASFDVCIIPYLKTDYTENVYPTKLNEYLYWSKPVIATDLVEIRYFAQEFPDLVSIAGNAQEFTRHLESAVAWAGDDTIRARRREVAELNSWENKLVEMSHQIELTLHQKESEQEKNWFYYFTQNYSRLKTRSLSLITAGLLALYLIFFSPLIWYLADPLKINELPQSSDAIVVLAGGVGESGQAGQGYEERVNQAVVLYKQGYARYLIFSSGYMYIYKEPLMMKSLAVSLGVPDSVIFLEDEATNTLKNIINCRKITANHGWKKLLMVSSPYHMKRVKLVIATQAPEWQVRYIPPHYNRYYSHRQGWQPFFSEKISYHQIRGIIHEYSSILYYWWKGWI